LRWCAYIVKASAAVKISIIIPVLNEEANLSRINDHLQSIRRQGHEVIVVDGGSVDNTLAIANEVTDLVIVSKAGRALQMNSGACVASGDVLLFLHADTFLPADMAQIISESFQRKNYWGRFDVRLSSSKYVYRLIEGFMNLRSCITSIATGDQAIFIEKKLFDIVGGFPEIALMEDIEISSRLKKISKPVCIKQKVVTSSQRWETNGVVATVLLMWKLRIYNFFGVSPEKLSQLY
jgi:rSAM/selenodomain-associated transferase 2